MKSLTMDMDSVWSKTVSVFRGIKEGFEKHIWPTFSVESLPVQVKETVANLPVEAQRDFFIEYENVIRGPRNWRNIGAVVFIFSVISGGFFLSIGILAYLWHTKEHRMPDLASKALKRSLKRHQITSGPTFATMLANKPTVATGRPGESVYTQPRKIVATYDPTRLTLDNVEKGFMIDFQTKTWEVVNTLQYDWNNGRSEREFKLMQHIESANIFLKNEGTHQVIGFMKPTNIFAIDERLEKEILSTRRPFNVLTYQGNTYYRESALEGILFDRPESQMGIKVSVWEYFDTDRRMMLRIEQIGSQQFRALAGSLVSAYEFTEILPKQQAS